LYIRETDIVETKELTRLTDRCWRSYYGGLLNENNNETKRR